MDNHLNVKLYDNVLSFSHLSKIKKDILRLYANNKFLKEDSKYVKNCFGLSNIPSTLQNINNILTKVKEDFGSQYVFTHSFSRIYFNGGNLNVHTDRPGLDLTGSLTVFSNLNKPWPLNFYCNTDSFSLDQSNLKNRFIEYKDNKISIHIEPNSMAVCHGTKVSHWREPLICDENQFSIHVFYHWTLNKKDTFFYE